MISTSPIQSESLHQGFVAGHSDCSLPCSSVLLLDSGADFCLSGIAAENSGTMFEIRDGRGALWVAEDARMEKKKQVARVL